MPSAARWSSPTWRLAPSWKCFMRWLKASALFTGLRCRGISSATASRDRRRASASARTSSALSWRAFSRASTAAAWRAPMTREASCSAGLGGSAPAVPWGPSGPSPGPRACSTASATTCSSVVGGRGGGGGAPSEPSSSGRASPVDLTLARVRSTSSLKAWAPPRKVPALSTLPTRSAAARITGSAESEATEEAACVMARAWSVSSVARASNWSRVAKHSRRSAMRGTRDMDSAKASGSDRDPGTGATWTSPSPAGGGARSARRARSSSVGRQSRRRSTSSAAVKSVSSQPRAASSTSA
mmetsp:Transcript_5708/g.19416  ORF Transcript_5708/g.19416 Transcript_5708/m.19416 type:complete len:299 (+) Transcript_5708:196-1092(+)